MHLTRATRMANSACSVSREGSHRKRGRSLKASAPHFCSGSHSYDDDGTWQEGGIRRLGGASFSYTLRVGSRGSECSDADSVLCCLRFRACQFYSHDWHAYNFGWWYRCLHSFQGYEPLRLLSTSPLRHAGPTCAFFPRKRTTYRGSSKTGGQTKMMFQNGMGIPPKYSLKNSCHARR